MTASAATSIPQSANRFVWLPLCLLILIDAMGFAMMGPILAAKPLADSPQLASILYGLAVGLYPLATFFAAPLLGALSDHLGRRPVLLICGSGLALSYIVISIGLNIGWASLVLIGRTVGGLTAATQAIALASLADIGPRKGKDQRITYGLLASSLGFVVGPVISGGLSEHHLGVSTPLYLVVLMTMVTMIWLRFGMPADQVYSEEFQLDFGKQFRELRMIFRSPVLRRLSLIFFLQQLGWGAFFFFIAPYLIQVFGFSTAAENFYMATVGAGFCLSFGLVMPLLRRYFPARGIGIWTMAVAGIGMLLPVLVSQAGVAWIVAVPVATAAAAGYGALIMLFTDEADGNEGAILGVTASINALAFGLSAVVDGPVAAFVIQGPIIFAACLMAGATILLLTHKQPTPTSS